MSRTYENEEQIYRDAWRIADPGASNPVAVAATLAAASSFLLHRTGTAEVRKHPALRVMAGQLAMLYDVNSLGADIEDLDRVKAVFDALEVDGGSAELHHGRQAAADMDEAQIAYNHLLMSNPELDPDKASQLRELSKSAQDDPGHSAAECSMDFCGRMPGPRRYRHVPGNGE
jgi:hypothetical protein